MNWHQLLELKHNIETLSKQRSMVFNIEAKEEAAMAFKKPLDFYYHTPFKEWVKVSRKLDKKREKVMDECVKLGILKNLPFNQFPHYRKRMGLKDRTP